MNEQIEAMIITAFTEQKQYETRNLIRFEYGVSVKEIEKVLEKHNITKYFI